jgi:hypothetical protein
VRFSGYDCVYQAQGEYYPCPQVEQDVIFDAGASILSQFITVLADVSLRPIQVAA